MRKKTVAPRKKKPIADKKRSTGSRTRSGAPKPSSDGAEFEVREFPTEELIEKSQAKHRGRNAGDRKPESEEFSPEAARLQAHVFAKRYRKQAQGFLWNRAKLLNVGDFIKIAGFEREFTKQTGSKGPREVRVIWTKND